MVVTHAGTNAEQELKIAGVFQLRQTVAAQAVTTFVDHPELRQQSAASAPAHGEAAR
jgi:hypothetical protein